jgi:hypothetical protein
MQEFPQAVPSETPFYTPPPPCRWALNDALWAHAQSAATLPSTGTFPNYDRCSNAGAAAEHPSWRWTGGGRGGGGPKSRQLLLSCLRTSVLGGGSEAQGNDDLWNCRQSTVAVQTCEEQTECHTGESIPFIDRKAAERIAFIIFLS